MFHGHARRLSPLWHAPAKLNSLAVAIFRHTIKDEQSAPHCIVFSSLSLECRGVCVYVAMLCLLCYWPE